MECPGCGSFIPADSSQCPLCKYVLQQPEVPADEGVIAATAARAVVGTAVGEKLPTQIRPYALPYWPLAGLVGGGVIALLVISLLINGLLLGNGLPPILAPSATATRTVGLIAATPVPPSPTTALRGKTATPARGKPTATPLAGTPTPDPTLSGGVATTTTPGMVFVTAVNCGGDASGQYLADAGYAGGNLYNTAATINTAAVPDPAPQTVYQTERWGNFTYTLPGLTAAASYVVRLQFAEIYFNQPNQRQFNVSINSQQVLTNFDIAAVAGGGNIAVERQFATTADAQGQVTITFANGAYDNAKCNGIELFQGTLPNG